MNDLKDLECDDFKIIKKLGRGAFGTVYKVEHRKSLKTYALKLYRDDKDFDILEDAAILSEKLKHPNLMFCYTHFYDRIVTKHNRLSGKSTTHLITILEYIRGDDLFNISTGDKRLTVKDMNHYLPQIISALQYLHKKKIVHRDIKPENILIDRENNVKLCDYDFLIDSGRTLLKGKVGTPYYLSPEVFSSNFYTCQTDLWSLGVTIYFCLSRQLPFEAEDRDELKKLILSSYEPNYMYLPLRYGQICRGLLRKDPIERMRLKEVLSLI